MTDQYSQNQRLDPLVQALLGSMYIMSTNAINNDYVPKTIFYEL